MKRIIYSFSALVALFCFASCDEKMNLEEPDITNNITITSQVNPHTKAGYETSENVTVLPDMFYIQIDQDGNDMDYRLPLYREPNTFNYLASIEMKWKGTDYSNCDIKAMTLPLGLTSLDMVKAMPVSISEEQRSVENLKASDLLGASTSIGGVEIANNNINISFRHLMSKLQISYNIPEQGVVINSVQLKNTCIKGGYSFASMDYDSSIAADFGDIMMYHETDKKSAEAIFFPYTPTSDPELVVNATVNDESKEFVCPIVLKNGSTGFVGGKRYIMTVTVSETEIEGVVTMIKDWNGESTLSDERILWIGTSIPEGGYPQIVGQALGCTVINNAVGGTLVTMQKDASWFNGTNWNPLLAGALVQTHAEAENIYGSKISSEELATIQSYSYESLIIPYIDGSKDNCTTVILDHGYNDLSSMLFELNGFNVTTDPYRGYSHLMQLINGEKTYQEYYSAVQSNPNLFEKGCYIIAMSHIIQSIREVAAEQNRDIRIIVGNYFAIDNPLLAFIYKAYNEDPDMLGSYPDYEYMANIICHSNEALASVNNLEIVNVYEHLYIADDMFCDLSKNFLNNLADPDKFCPDGVHPTNEHARQAIANVYITELSRLLGR